MSRQVSRNMSMKKSFSMKQKSLYKQEEIMESGDIKDKLNEAQAELKEMMSG